MNRSSRQTSTDYSHPHRPWPIAMANRVGGYLEPTGLGRADLSADYLVSSARRRTGLTDLGDGGFLERLQLLLRSIEDEARLHPLGRWMAQQNMLRILVNRLRILDAFSQRPQIQEEAIRAPLFVVGLQRTGTTKLHRMLAADPLHRFLPSWEAISPVPHRLDQGGVAGGRLWQARVAAQGLRFLAPDFYAIHPVDPEGPEEDCLLFDFALWGTVPEATMQVPGFSAWLEAQDHGPAYGFFADMLKLLAWLRPGGRWVLKTPQHMEHLDALLEVFPDARIVQTHRDPVKVLASFCSMMAHSRGVFSDQVDPCEVGRHWFAKARLMVGRAMAVRDAHPENFIDVAYDDLLTEPMGQIERIYDFAEEPLSMAARQAMTSWMRSNPQHKHGRHRYRLRDFGLDRDEVEQAFAAYRERFASPREELGE